MLYVECFPARRHANALKYWSLKFWGAHKCEVTLFNVESRDVEVLQEVSLSVETRGHEKHMHDCKCGIMNHERVLKYVVFLSVSITTIRSCD